MFCRWSCTICVAEQLLHTPMVHEMTSPKHSWTRTNDQHHHDSIIATGLRQDLKLPRSIPLRKRLHTGTATLFPETITASCDNINICRRRAVAMTVSNGRNLVLSPSGKIDSLSYLGTLQLQNPDCSRRQPPSSTRLIFSVRPLQSYPSVHIAQHHGTVIGRRKGRRREFFVPAITGVLFFSLFIMQSLSTSRSGAIVLSYQSPAVLHKRSNSVFSKIQNEVPFLKVPNHHVCTMETPSMFLTSASCPKLQFKTSDAPVPFKVIRIEEASLSTLKLVEPNYRRGALGFQIYSEQELDKKVGTRLQVLSRNEETSQSLSNVDASAWNLAERLSVESTYTRPRIGSKKRISVGEAPKTSVDGEGVSDVASTTSIPWIPNTDEIETLTVMQLKEELGARALKKTGNKYDLQQRMKEWSSDQVKRQRLLARGAAHANDLTSLNLRSAYGVKSSESPSTIENEILSWGIDSSSFLASTAKEAPSTRKSDRLQVDSLAEWARTVDLEPLLHRREAIHRDKLKGKVPLNKKLETSPMTEIQPSEYLTVLKKMFDQPSSPYSNREVKQMYAAAKHADQIGDRELSKRILVELKAATPGDARIIRRLARMEREDGNISAAREILKEGLELHPDNAFLWNGLAQLEGSVYDESSQRKFLEKAIEVDPSLPHSYHALGTLEHSQGRIANAMRILKQGVEYCPTNHRLHHALGDLYRDAKMLSMATTSYLKAIKHGPPVSYGFAYTALAYVAYEEGHVDRCRKWLHKAVKLNNGRHANGWVALAQFEESEGNIDAARSACIAGIGQYERGLLEHSRKVKLSPETSSNERRFLEDPVALKNNFLKAVPSYRSGDRFYNVYRNWLRLEERYGSMDSAEEVYDRAAVAFRHDWKLPLDAAQYYAKLNMAGRARSHFSVACTRAGSNHADPYRRFAEFEMSRGNHVEARRILYSGATSMVKNGFESNDRRGLSELFLTWAVCEWSLDNLLHAGKLFHHALALIESMEDGSSKLRSFILYTLARFEYSRREYRRAQHFIGLCLKENRMPGGNSMVWDLWGVIAHEMGDARLAFQCQEQTTRCRSSEDDNRSGISGLSEMLSSGIKTDEMHQMMRKDPWHPKIFGNHSDNDKFLSVSLLPQLMKQEARQREQNVPASR